MLVCVEFDLNNHVEVSAHIVFIFCFSKAVVEQACPTT